MNGFLLFCKYSLKSSLLDKNIGDFIKLYSILFFLKKLIN